MSFYKINTDGGSRGNPGPGASAFVVWESDQVINSEGKAFQNTTNNKAEYTALLMACEWLSAQKPSVEKVEFYLDSELVVKQMNGVYKIKDQDLFQIAQQIKTLAKGFAFPVSYTHVRREFNKEADLLVNETLDTYLTHVEKIG